jgi:hypothetical protein
MVASQTCCLRQVFDSARTHVGVAEAISKAAIPHSKDANNRDRLYDHYIAYSHNLFADPHMNIWTSAPFGKIAVANSKQVRSLGEEAGASLPKT